jgi:hypothetical protein
VISTHTSYYSSQKFKLWLSFYSYISFGPPAKWHDKTLKQPTNCFLPTPSKLKIHDNSHSMLNNLHVQYKKVTLDIFFQLSSYNNKVKFSYDAQMLHEIATANSIKSNSMSAELLDHRLTVYIYDTFSNLTFSLQL